MDHNLEKYIGTKKYAEKKVKIGGFLVIVGVILIIVGYTITFVLGAIAIITGIIFAGSVFLLLFFMFHV